MLSRAFKKSFYMLASPLMRLNSWIYRNSRAPRGQNVRVHLGPGQRNYIQGWINVDANMFTAKCDIWADLRTSLPFPDASVDAFYSHHVAEHLPDLQRHIENVFRCLKPGGIYRIGGPNGDAAVKKFLENDTKWFDDFPDKRRSIGGRFNNFIFCRNEHLSLLIFSYLEELMTDAGFADIRQFAPRKTGKPEIFKDCMRFEYPTDPAAQHTLMVEARRPF